MEQLSSVVVNLPLDPEVYDDIIDMRLMRIAMLKSLKKEGQSGRERLEKVLGKEVPTKSFKVVIDEQVKLLEDSIAKKLVNLEDIEFYLDLAVRSGKKL